VIKDAKEQLRALPDGVTYGLLRYLNPDVELGGAEPGIGFNYLGRLGAVPVSSPRSCGASTPSRTLSAAAAAIDMPLMHTVELNAGTLDTDAGPRLQASWTWAPRRWTPSRSTGWAGCGSRRSAGSAPMCSTAAAG
jgi:glycopeptidolipid biosynthesis protein